MKQMLRARLALSPDPTEIDFFKVVNTPCKRNFERPRSMDVLIRYRRIDVVINEKEYRVPESLRTGRQVIAAGGGPTAV